jgi:hypothetical protein
MIGAQVSAREEISMLTDPPPDKPTTEERLADLERRALDLELNPRPPSFYQVLESVPWYGWLYFGAFMGAVLARRRA